MAEMYFDIEVAFLSNDSAESLRKGLKINPTPKNSKIITIQYQILDENGNAKTPLRIFKEWESSEEAIIRKVRSILNPRTKWEFVPVGHNIYFDLGMFKERAKLYGHAFDDWQLYHDMPAIDLKHICLALNGFVFRDSGLDKFTAKETSGYSIPIWYAEQKFDQIIDYVMKEAKEFVEFYSKLKTIMPDVRKQHGLYNRFLNQSEKIQNPSSPSGSGV